MSTGIQHHVFLSYSRKDTPIMQRVRDDLRESGLDVWTDENLEPGTHAWETAIANAIRGAGCMVALLSPDAEQSQWVGRELAYAETLNVRIFPLLARGDERESVPLRLISYQWIDARYNYFQAAQMLVAAIQTFLKDMILSAPQPPPAPRSSHTTTAPVSRVPVDVRPLWTFQAEDEIRCSPVVFNNGVFVGAYDHHLYALQLKTGHMVWKFQAKGGLSTPAVIAAAQGRVLFGAEDSFFYALDYRTGRPAWSFLTGNRIHGAPSIAHDHVFFGSDDGNLYALTVANGRLHRSYPTFAPVRSRPYVNDELVIFGSDSGEVIGMELSGTRQWTFRSRGKVSSSPCVDKQLGRCYIGSSDSYVYALDIHKGFVEWRFRTGSAVFSSPVVQEGLVYIGSGDGNVYAINAVSGEQKWEFRTGKSVVAAPALHNGALFIGSMDSNFYALDAHTGKELWRFRTGGPILASACLVGDTILVGSLDKTLYALPLSGNATGL